MLNKNKSNIPKNEIKSKVENNKSITTNVNLKISILPALSCKV